MLALLEYDRKVGTLISSNRASQEVTPNLGDVIGFIKQSGFLNGHVEPERNFTGFILHKSFITSFDAGCEAAGAQS